MNTRLIKPLMGSVYTAVLIRPADGGGGTSMAPDFSMPETLPSTRPTSIIDQVIPGVNMTLPTPSNPSALTIANPATLAPTTTPAAPAPWYQWFLDNPIPTGLILVAGGIIIYQVTKKKGK